MMHGTTNIKLKITSAWTSAQQNTWALLVVGKWVIFSQYCLDISGLSGGKYKYEICCRMKKWCSVGLISQKLTGISTTLRGFAAQNNKVQPVIFILLFCTMTNKCTIISQIITLLHISTLSCHPQGACNQYLAKLHKYVKCSWWLIQSCN